MELKDKVAIVTGSGRGIGEGIAMVLAREGARLVIVDMNIDDAQKVVKKIEAGGGKAIATRTDISRKADVEAMVAETVKAFGTVDVLVNNAGIEAPPCLVKDMPEAQWDRVLGINLKGTFFCCQAVLGPMMVQNSGRIINIASTAAIRMTFFGSADYTVSKHGVAGLTQHLAWEVADHRITVNSICPGGVFTPLMAQHTTEDFREMVSKRLIPLGRMCTIEEIGEAVSFLASDRAQMITGQMLAVDGGLLTGFGEDLRPIVRKRMDEAKAAKATQS
jgi:NAD(P)-dependent dehydrogenase (short-subunit alcohol dehydrogenase family)